MSAERGKGHKTEMPTKPSLRKGGWCEAPGGSTWQERINFI